MYCYAQPANLRTSTVFVLIYYNRELKIHFLNRNVFLLWCYQLKCLRHISLPTPSFFSSSLKAAFISIYPILASNLTPHPFPTSKYRLFLTFPNTVLLSIVLVFPCLSFYRIMTATAFICQNTPSVHYTY